MLRQGFNQNRQVFCRVSLIDPALRKISHKSPEIVDRSGLFVRCENSVERAKIVFECRFRLVVALLRGRAFKVFGVQSGCL